MARRLIVHVGQMKSGTTFIQQTLAHNRDVLLDAGVLYPGPRFNQQHACYGLCGRDVYWVRDPAPYHDSASALVESIVDHPGTVLVSAEALSCMAADGVERFARRIGGFDSVVVTIRNLLSTLLSAWQQGAKRGSEMSLDEFFTRLHRERETESGLWRNYAFGNTVRWWSRFAETNVLVVESFARDEVAAAFLRAAGIDGVDLSVPELSAQDRNLSLRREDVELLRALNAVTNRSERDRDEEFRGFLLQHLFFPAAQARLGSPITFPARHLDAAIGWARDEIEKFPRTAVVHGDVDVLASPDQVEIAESEAESVDPVVRIESLLHLWFQRNGPHV